MSVDTWGAIDQKFRQTKSAPVVCAHCQVTKGLEKHNIAAEGTPEKNVLLCVPCIEFHKQSTTSQWYWSTGSDPGTEDFNVAPSREAAIQAATETAYDEGFDAITICYSTPYIIDNEPFSGNINEVMTWWRDLNDEVSDHIDDDPTMDQTSDLECMLNDAFAAWRLKHRFGLVAAPNQTANLEVIELDPDEE